MPRPRKYPQIENDRARFSDYDSRYIPAVLRNTGATPFTKAQCDHWRKTAGWNRRHGSSVITYRSRNGRNDPLSIMLVIDCLMRIETNSTLQSNNLTTLLWDNYPQVAWDAVTVGVIMRGLVEISRPIFDAGTQPPFDEYRARGRRLFIISDDLHARRYMGHLRNRAEALARDAVEAQKSGDDTRTIAVWDDLGLVDLELGV